jgi:hypothetical protein
MKPAQLVTITSHEVAVTVELHAWEAFLDAQIKMYDCRILAGHTKQMRRWKRLRKKQGAA